MTPLATLLAAVLIVPSHAGDTSPPMPQTEQAWTEALARPEYKGPDPCAHQTKGICTADDYHPQAQALVRFRLDSYSIDPDYNRALDELAGGCRTCHPRPRRQHRQR